MVTAWEGALAERLDDGALDLAVGWIPQLKARKTSTLLFKDRYVGVREAPRGRPAAGPARYAVADVPRSAHQIVAERFRLRALEPVVATSNFFMLSELLAGTSLTAVVPGHLARLWPAGAMDCASRNCPSSCPACPSACIGRPATGATKA